MSYPMFHQGAGEDSLLEVPGEKLPNGHQYYSWENEKWAFVYTAVVSCSSDFNLARAQATRAYREHVKTKMEALYD